MVQTEGSKCSKALRSACVCQPEYQCGWRERGGGGVLGDEGRGGMGQTQSHI